MTSEDRWPPTHADPLFIMAMDHRGSFGKSLFDVKDDHPTDEQSAKMRAAKSLIYAGLTKVAPSIATGRAGVLVDEHYGQAVIDAAQDDGIVLAVPIEASGHDWFTLEFGDEWLEHVRTIRPAYAKVLVRDNPDFPSVKRTAQLASLAAVSTALAEAGVAFLYELLVPGTDEQLASVDNDTDRYDRELRAALVVRVMADNQAAGVAPTVWKVEGLESVEDARLVAEQAGDARLIVLGRDAPVERLNHWLQVAAEVEQFVGFAIGRSIWEDAIGDWVAGKADDEATVDRIAETYLGFTKQWA